MNYFFKKERLLLTLIIIFGIFFGILGGILKRTTYRDQEIKAPGIAFGFLAMHDGALSKDKPATPPAAPQETPEAPETDTEPAPATEPAPTAEPEAEPEETPAYEFCEVYPSYFTDALFIGDSRTDGLRLYAPFEGADYFCSTGMSVTGCLDETADIEGLGTVTLAQLLEQRDYGKIYISLGINDVGYDHSVLVPYFEDIYNFLREQEPDAIVYIMASMHVAKNRAINEPMFESERVDHLNGLFGEFADGEHSFFIDENEAFDDEEGYLIADWTGDNVHLYARYYEVWDNWLCRNAVVIPGMANPGDVPPAPEPAEEETSEETSEETAEA